MRLRNISTPKCCGNNMKLMTEGIRFVEIACKKCGDVIYMKKKEEYVPQLIDD